MENVLFRVGDFEVTALTAVVVLLALALAWAGRQRAAEARRAERHLAAVMQKQAEMSGRMQTMAEIFTTRQGDFARLVSDRLDTHGKKSEESLTRLNERLAVIDRAQANITELSRGVVSLQSILANKQTRGAFGQGRMEAIIADGLPLGAYAFQHTLANNSRPDCVVFMPNGAPPLVIDAKFPLESWQRLGAAENAEETKIASLGFRQDMQVHIRAIAEKYLAPGETQDTAFLFVPSESIFADIHERFEDVVQRAARVRVVIVSPSLLMLSIQVVQALLRDVRIREEAHRIQHEVAELLTDVGRLDERVRKLQTHFRQASDDIGDILTSSGKVTRRGERIAAMEFDEAPERERRAGQ
jgi:DNA recombination protein RmuC